MSKIDKKLSVLLIDLCVDAVKNPDKVPVPRYMDSIKQAILEVVRETIDEPEAFPMAIGSGTAGPIIKDFIRKDLTLEAVEEALE
jgi:hypothetical protein